MERAKEATPLGDKAKISGQIQIQHATRIAIRDKCNSFNTPLACLQDK